MRQTRYDTGMLGGRLKGTDAKQRPEEFGRQSSRTGWLFGTPLCVLMLIALWAGVVLQFLYFRFHTPEPLRLANVGIRSSDDYHRQAKLAF